MGGKTKVVVKNGSSGISFLGLLAILFIALKLTGYITWSWIWVLSPLWIGLALVLGALILFGLFALVAFLLSHIFDR